MLNIITNHQAGTRWTPDSAGFRLIRGVAATVHLHFNPGDPWRPATNPGQFRNPLDTGT